MLDSKNANKAYVDMFMDINEDLKKMRNNEDLATAFEKDTSNAYDAFQEKIDQTAEHIDSMAAVVDLPSLKRHSWEVAGEAH